MATGTGIFYLNCIITVKRGDALKTETVQNLMFEIQIYGQKAEILSTKYIRIPVSTILSVNSLLRDALFIGI
jgi:hypothetical protein